MNFRQGMFNKFSETDYKYAQIENNTSKKLDELIQQIKTYIPINVNVNANNQMINNNNVSSNSQSSPFQFGYNNIPNNQIFSNNVPINSSNINIVSSGEGIQVSSQSVNLPGSNNHLVSNQGSININNNAQSNNINAFNRSNANQQYSLPKHGKKFYTSANLTTVGNAFLYNFS